MRTREHVAASCVLRGLDQAAQVRDLVLEQLRKHRTAASAIQTITWQARNFPFDPETLREIWDEARKLRETLAAPNSV
jgi:hypothetical protein